MNQERQYVGKGKTVGKYGNLKISLKVSDLKPNDKGYADIIISKMKEADKWGNEFTVYNNDFVPQTRINNKPLDAAPVTTESTPYPF